MSQQPLMTFAADAGCRKRRLSTATFVVVATMLSCAGARAQMPDSDSRAGQADTAPPNRLMGDIKNYVTAPLRWDGTEWAYFGGALVAIAAAHHYDTDVRTHFTKDSGSVLGVQKSKTLQDALPGAAAFAGTWLYANLTNDNDGRKEAWGMLEAAGLSSATGFILKYAAGRERPDETTNPNRWRAGSDSFPSLHVTAATAIGTVLAESGNDEYRWVRRFVGYGIAGLTGYERLKHNAHWLSDTVAGAALGASTARFVMHRTYRTDKDSSLMLLPIDHGVMLTYSATLP